MLGSRWEFGPSDQPGELERGRLFHVMKRFTFGRTDGRVGEGANESLIAFKGRAKGIKQRE